MNPAPGNSQASKEKLRDISESITETFAKPEPSDFMSSISKLMEAYGVMNLSKETGIDRVTLWHFIRGNRLPRLDTLQKILIALGIKVQFSIDSRMKDLIEYTYWRKQWESKNSLSGESVGHKTEAKMVS